MLDEFTAKTGVNPTQLSVDVVFASAPAAVIVKSPAALTANLVAVLVKSEF